MTRWLHRWHARRTANAPPARGFRELPEPRAVGSMARGQALVAGQMVAFGHRLDISGHMIWDMAMPDPAFADDIERFTWLDDLAALGDTEARHLAQFWLWGWIERNRRGDGPGWDPGVTGQRVLRWIQHAVFLLQGQSMDAAEAFFRALSHQGAFLERRASLAEPGLARFEASTAWLMAGLLLDGKDAWVTPALAALVTACQEDLTPDGTLPTRSPEDLLAVFTHLSWVRNAMSAAGRDLPPELRDRVAQIAPNLRTLRHADGALARFHGGGPGTDGLLDLSLAEAGIKTRPRSQAMGFVRLSASRTSLIIDAAPPPSGRASWNAHAATLAFELTSGRRPLIVNCGSGAPFGTDWLQAGRATPSHSTLALQGHSSARLGAQVATHALPRAQLIDGPRHVPVDLSRSAKMQRFEGGHDGYVASHGLTHARILELSTDGRSLSGEDLLMALDAPAKDRFDARWGALQVQGVPFQVRFHLHPEVSATLDQARSRVSMALRSGEYWIFQHDGVGALSLEPSVYLDADAPEPRATKQIVLTHQAISYATRLRWSLAKAQETAIAVRDFARDEIAFDET